MSEIPKRPVLGQTLAYTSDLAKHEHAVAKALWEAINQMSLMCFDDPGIAHRADNWKRCGTCSGCNADAAIENIVKSGWKP